MRPYHSWLWALLAVLTLGLSACAPEQQPAGTLTDASIRVAPTFRELYQTLGGVDVLGPPISEPFDFQGDSCQYTRNALMCYDSLVTEGDRFFLYPLGQYLDLPQPSKPVETEPTVYEEFLPLYDQLSGERFAGRALSGPLTNYAQNRIEQYFENVGFYRNLADSSGRIGLLAYGAYTCTQECATQPDDLPGSLVQMPSGSVEQPFLTDLLGLGGLSIFGQPLSQPYTAPDGALEQVYENVVLFALDENAQRLRLRPLPLLTGIQPDPLVPASDKRGMVFYPLEESGAGLHVPEVFDQFIARHGGPEISGAPITAMQQLDGDLYRQCFQNYCLEYRHLAPENSRIRLSTLGPKYLQAAGIDPALIVRRVYTPETVRVHILKAAATLGSDETQNLEIQVLDSEQAPITGVNAFLLLKLPDGREMAGVFPPTDAQGISSLVVRPVDELPNGSVISYQICLNVPATERICTSDSYLIWD